MSTKKKSVVEKKTLKPTAGMGFVSFSSVTASSSALLTSLTESSTTQPESTSTPTNDYSLLPLYTGSDSEYSVASKKLLKKDPITRLKALQEMLDIIKQRGPDVIQDIIPFYIYAFNRLIHDNNRNVREQSNMCLRSLLEIDKRLFQNYLKNLIGPWWLSISDPCQEVAEAAELTFYNTFPPKKRESVPFLLSDPLFRYLKDNFEITLSTLSASDKSSAQDEIEERYERLLISSFRSLSRFIQILSDENNHKLTEMNTLEGSNKIQFGYKDILTETLFNHLINPKYSIRQELFQLLNIICKRIPFSLNIEIRPKIIHLINENINQVTINNSNNTHFQTILYQTFIIFSKQYPDSWEIPTNKNNLKSNQVFNLKKGILPKLREQIKPSAEVILPLLLPLFHSIPPSIACVTGRAAEPIYNFLVYLSTLSSSTSSESSSALGTSSGKSSIGIPPQLLWLTVAEACTFLLLRPQPTPQPEINPSVSMKSDVAGSVDSLVKAYCELLVDNICNFIRHGATESSRDTDPFLMSEGSGLRSASRDFSQQFSRLLVQLHRATVIARDMSTDRWEELLWQPLVSRLRQILVHKMAATHFSTPEESIHGLFDSVSSLQESIGVVVRGVGGVFDLSKTDSMSTSKPSEEGEGAVVSPGIGLFSLFKALLLLFSNKLYDNEETLSTTHNIHTTTSTNTNRSYEIWVKNVSCVSVVLESFTIALVTGRTIREISNISVSMLRDIFPPSLLTNITATWLRHIFLCLDDGSRGNSHRNKASDSSTSARAVEVLRRATRELLGNVSLVLNDNNAGISPNSLLNETRQELVGYSVTGNSVHGFVSLLQSGCIGVEYYAPFDWEEDVVDWLKFTLDQLLKANHNNPSQRSKADDYHSDAERAVCLVTSLAKIENLFSRVDVISLTVSEWESTQSNSSAWALLSLYNLTRQDSCPNELLKTQISDRLSEDTILNLLQHVFFSYNDRSTYDDSHDNLIGEGRGSVIINWGDVQSYLFPVISPSLKKNLICSLADRLRKDFSVMATSRSGCENIDGNSDSSGSAERSVDPQYLARSTINVLLMAKNCSQECSLELQDVIATLDISNEVLWTELCSRARDHRFPDDHTDSSMTVTGPERVIDGVSGGQIRDGVLTSVTSWFSHMVNISVEEGISVWLLSDYLLDIAKNHRVTISILTFLHAMKQGDSPARDGWQSVLSYLSSQGNNCLQFITALGYQLLRNSADAAQVTMFHDLLESLSQSSALLEGRKGVLLSSKRSSDKVNSSVEGTAQKAVTRFGHTVDLLEETPIMLPFLSSQAVGILLGAEKDTCLRYIRVKRLERSPSSGHTAAVDEYSIRECRLQSGSVVVAAEGTVKSTKTSDPLWEINLEGESESLAVHGSRLLLANGQKTAASEDFTGVDRLEVVGEILEPNSTNEGAREDFVGLSVSGRVVEIKDDDDDDDINWSRFINLQMELLSTVLSDLKHSSSDPVVNSQWVDVLLTAFAMSVQHDSTKAEHLLWGYRGIIIHLLKYDVVINPQKNTLGLKLLENLFNHHRNKSVNAGSSLIGHGLWLGQVFQNLSSSLESIQAKTRLVLGKGGGMPLITAYLRIYRTILLEIESVGVAVDAMTLITFAMGLYESWGTGNSASIAKESSPEAAFEIEILTLLRTLWFRRSRSSKENNAAATSSSAKAAAINRLIEATELPSWELPGINFVILTLLESDSQSKKALCVAAEAVHLAFLARDRSSGCALIQPSVLGKIDFESGSGLEESFLVMLHDRGDGVGGGGVGAAQDPKISLQVKLCVAKLLDVVYASRRDSNLATEAVDEHADVREDEGDDGTLDSSLRVFREILGPVLGDWLMRCGKEEYRKMIFDEGVVFEIEEEYKGYEQGDDVDVVAADSSLASTGTRKEQISEIATTYVMKSDSTEGVSPRYDQSYSFVLLWLLALQKASSVGVGAGGTLRKARVLEALRQSGSMDHIFRMLCHLCPNLLGHTDLPATLQKLYIDEGKNINYGHEDTVQGAYEEAYEGKLRRLAAYAIFRTVCELPALARQWWVDLGGKPGERGLKNTFKKFVEESVNFALVSREVASVSSANMNSEIVGSTTGTREVTAESSELGTELIVRASAISREVTAVYVQEDARLELRVRLPRSYPLVLAEVECSSRLGFAEGRWDRWKLQIIQRLSQQNGSVVDAVRAWKQGVDQELVGVEPCPICYSTLHPKLLSLPSLGCRTCRNKFHSSCLYKWFQSSGKSKCVICQEPFFQ